MKHSANSILRGKNLKHIQKIIYSPLICYIRHTCIHNTSWIKMSIIVTEITFSLLIYLRHMEMLLLKLCSNEQITMFFPVSFWYLTMLDKNHFCSSSRSFTQELIRHESLSVTGSDSDPPDPSGLVCWDWINVTLAYKDENGKSKSVGAVSDDDAGVKDNRKNLQLVVV